MVNALLNPLPARLSLHLKAARRGQKLARKLKEADGIVCSHTKSGRTWLRVMVSAVYHKWYGIPESLLIEHDNFNKLDGRVPKLHFGSIRVQSPGGRLLAEAAESVPTIFLVRDPRDTAASFYHHMRLRASSLERFRKGFHDVDFSRLSLFEFMVSPDFGVPRVAAHAEWQLEQARRRSRSLVLRYEDMREDPHSWLREVISFVDEHPISAEALGHAVAFGSFREMKDKELMGFFEGDRLGAADSADANSLKVRKALPGSYREELTQEQLSRIDDLAAASPSFQELYGAT